MWRLIALTTLLLTFALGAAADAKCRLCIESVSAVGSGNAGWGRTIDLRFAARAMDGGVFPDSATAVVMQVDGDRSKCITVALRRIDTSGDLATYGGTFTGYGQTTHSGRLDIGGDVFDFTVPLNGVPGTVTLIGVAPPPTVATLARTVVVPAAATQQAPQAPQAAPAKPAAAWLDLSTPDRQGMLLAFGVIAFTAVSVYFERRRALLRRTGAAAEA